MEKGEAGHGSVHLFHESLSELELVNATEATAYFPVVPCRFQASDPLRHNPRSLQKHLVCLESKLEHDKGFAREPFD